MKTRRAVLGVLISGCLLAMPVIAQQSGESQTPSTNQNSTSQSSNNQASNLPSQGKHFLDHLAKDSQGMVQLAKLAENKTSNPAVKKFAQRMVQDHTKLDQQVKEVMQRNGINTPQPLTAKQQKLEERLEKLSGQQFDKAYMRAMVKEHNKAVQGLQKEANNAKNQDVQQVASTALPVIKEHLQLAKSTAQQVGVNVNSALNNASSGSSGEAGSGGSQPPK